MKNINDAVLAHCHAHRPEFLNKLTQYIACQSVSTDPAYADGMEAARCWLEEYLIKNKFDNVQRLESNGQACVYADWLHAADQPTILIYGHYDVQPPDPDDAWKSPPFELSVRNARAYARGISDDKGPSLIALEVLSAYLAVENALPVNIRILLEGEEETGSPSLSAVLEEHRTLLQADAVLSADGARWRADLPALNIGSRGNGGLGITLTTASKDLHSGRYGGAVPNALHTMAQLLASLHDTNGLVTVRGFYDDVAEADEATRNNIKELPFNETQWLAPLNAHAFGEAEWSSLERLWLRPTLEVNGMWGGYQGTGAKTVIPNEAHAKLTTRMVTGQDPAQVERCLREHLKAHCPAYAQLHIEEQHGWVGAYTVPEDHPLLNAAESALQHTTGRKPVRVRIGATLPLTQLIKEALEIDTIMFSFSTADENFHAPNEFLRLKAIDQGLAAWVRILREIPKYY